MVNPRRGSRIQQMGGVKKKERIKRNQGVVKMNRSSGKSRIVKKFRDKKKKKPKKKIRRTSDAGIRQPTPPPPISVPHISPSIYTTEEMEEINQFFQGTPLRQRMMAQLEMNDDSTNWDGWVREERPTYIHPRIEEPIQEPLLWDQIHEQYELMQAEEERERAIREAERQWVIEEDEMDELTHYNQYPANVRREYREYPIDQQTAEEFELVIRRSLDEITRRMPRDPSVRPADEELAIINAEMARIDAEVERLYRQVMEETAAAERRVQEAAAAENNVAAVEEEDDENAVRVIYTGTELTPYETYMRNMRNLREQSHDEDEEDSEVGDFDHLEMLNQRPHIERRPVYEVVPGRGGIPFWNEGYFHNIVLRQIERLRQRPPRPPRVRISYLKIPYFAPRQVKEVAITDFVNYNLFFIKAPPPR
ncbi:hypothetical protein B9Z55_026237 [Caenorhabditis nigoni]|uniref:Uncharacterized protein n=1 Tax=Caenorhabditis nigoni TaxID=1611254 RepID=A0A2G5T2E8_9PELO|nr:hypothetical protein B9Z55_026237 [Caenorhabditis nigoni]